MDHAVLLGCRAENRRWVASIVRWRVLGRGNVYHAGLVGTG